MRVRASRSPDAPTPATAPHPTQLPTNTHHWSGNHSEHPQTSQHSRIANRQFRLENLSHLSDEYRRLEVVSRTANFLSWPDLIGAAPRRQFRGGLPAGCSIA